jgi:hypothetical protein
MHLIGAKKGLSGVFTAKGEDAEMTLVYACETLCRSLCVIEYLRRTGLLAVAAAFTAGAIGLGIQLNSPTPPDIEPPAATKVSNSQFVQNHRSFKSSNECTAGCAEGCSEGMHS